MEKTKSAMENQIKKETDVEQAIQYFQHDVEIHGFYSEVYNLNEDDTLSEGYSSGTLLDCLSVPKVEQLYVLAARIELKYPKYTTRIEEKPHNQNKIIFSIFKKQDENG